jgi:hypothetical protein
MNRQNGGKLAIRYAAIAPAIGDLESDIWYQAEIVEVSHYWSAQPAPAGRHFQTRMLWSDRSLHVRFDAAQSEPLTVSPDPDLSSKTIGLWERDVCEIFIAPDVDRPNNYYEFEVAPTGEWVDLGIRIIDGVRRTDREYASKMRTAARIDKDRILMSLSINWEAFGKRPEIGEHWSGNIFRCVGRGPRRGYLSWQATETEKPDFHVPGKFGRFEFLG